MKPLARYTLLLIALEIFVLLAGFLITDNFYPGFNLTDVIILSVCFVLISLSSMIIFFRGRSKSPESQTMHSLVSISLKFLLELILVFIWFFIGKKSGLTSVLLFFVIYLTFTLFLIFIILKTLKNKSL